MKRPLWIIQLSCLLAVALVSVKAQAVEVLGNGDFEAAAAPTGWTIAQSVTGRPDLKVSAVEQIGFANEPMAVTGESGIWLQAFQGNQIGGGDFDGNFVVDGADFLAWQRNLGRTTGATKEQGDANADGDVDKDDLTEWKNRFSRSSTERVNASLSQTVAATPGQTYTFTGHALFEPGYSGGSEFLSFLSPSDPGMTGTVPTPTRTRFEITFLDAANAVVGTPVSRELRIDDAQMNDRTWALHTVTGVAPPGAAAVRVTAGATDMIYQGAGAQSAFIDNFSLMRSGAPGTELLSGGNFNAAPTVPGWVLEEMPDGRDTAAFQNATFAAHSGTVGVWLKAFAGFSNLEPSDAILSQTVPAAPGGIYTFSGWSKWEKNYSGGLTTLVGGPLDGQPSPTQTTLEIAFLNASNAVVGTPTVLDLRTVQTSDNMWHQHMVSATAPAGTASVRVRASALDMVLTNDVGGGQSAFWDDFSLQLATAAPAASAVPEPTSFAAAIVGSAVVALCGRRRRVA